MKTFALATAALGLVITATPALAGPTDRPIEKVSTAGLDLATPAGQELLDQRITRAAKSVCQVARVRTGTRLKRAANQACVAKARASAKRQVAALIVDQRLGG